VKRLSRVALPAALALLALVLLAVVVAGAEPAPSPSAVASELLSGGDLRSEGQGPGLVGNPLLILLAVVALGLATAAVTFVLVRLDQRR
jgi:hypothetical protein